MTFETSDPAERAILNLLAGMATGKSVCPTQAARALAGNPPGEQWRASLSPIRLAALRLAKAGKIEILRKGKPISPDALHGVIRLRLTSPA
jgi:Protein of unknown function (DUF3253)